MSRQNALPLSIVLLLVLVLLACRLSPGTPEETATATPTVSVETPSASVPTATLEPTATPQPVATPRPKPTPTAEPTPTLRAPQADTVSCNGVTFDAGAVLGDTICGLTESMGEASTTHFTFAPDGDCRKGGCVDIYPVQAYREAFPDWPLPPVGAATILQAKTQSLAFENGTGTRSVRMYGQDTFWANNGDLVYDYQGFTDDGEYYVYISYPIDAPMLLSSYEPDENTNEDAIPVPVPLPDDYAELSTVMQEYNRNVAAQLDQLADVEFVPGLDVLDALVASLRIEPPPAAGPGTGPLSMVALIPPELLGEVTELQVDSNGAVWVSTSRGYGIWHDGEWTVQLVESNYTLIGVDGAGRMWLFIEEEGGQVYVWDGVFEPEPAAAGWPEVPYPDELAGRGVLTDADGRTWLVTNRDVRVFDGAEWSAFSLDDLGMAAPPDEYMPLQFTLELIGESGQVWVGECTWGGPGPMGGGGARWFEGQAWQGADSPAGSGCVYAIKEDALGRVWVGVDSDLWRYDPSTGEWTRFAPPQAPDAYRFMYITEIAVDPAGEPWVVFPLCGGASCVGDIVRYRLHDGAWEQVGGISPEEPQTLLFDGAGTPWLLGGGVYRMDADGPVEPPDALIAVRAVRADAAGRIWVAGWQVGITGVQPATDMALWVLDPAASGGTGCGCISR